MNILLTSVGRRTYMVQYFKHILQGKGIVHAANSIDTYALREADEFVITPLIYDGNYIDFLLEYCLKNNIKLIIPLFDIDLPILSKNIDQFKAHNIQIMVSNQEFVKICNDKWLTYQFLKNNNILTPLSFLNIKDALKAVELGLLKFPLIIKPRWGMGSIGIFEVDNDEELLILYKKVQKNINTTYLKYESEESPEENIIIQEKIIGEEYGIDVFNNLNGSYLTCIPKKKLGMRAGETDSAVILNENRLVEMGKKISNISNHIGNLDVDCFLVENRFFVLEMNCRFGGQYPFSHLAGANFPELILDMALGIKISDDDKRLKYKEGTIGVKDIRPVIFKQ